MAGMAGRRQAADCRFCRRQALQSSTAVDVRPLSRAAGTFLGRAGTSPVTSAPANGWAIGAVPSATPSTAVDKPALIDPRLPTGLQVPHLSGTAHPFLLSSSTTKRKRCICLRFFVCPRCCSAHPYRLFAYAVFAACLRPTAPRRLEGAAILRKHSSDAHPIVLHPALCTLHSAHCTALNCTALPTASHSPRSARESPCRATKQ